MTSEQKPPVEKKDLEVLGNGQKNKESVAKSDPKPESRQNALETN